MSFRFGWPTDLMAPGDWDGDGRDEPGVYRAGNWFVRDSLTGGTPTRRFTFGWHTDVPVVGDWDGDGAAEPGVVRGTARGDVWYLRRWQSAGSASVWFRAP